MADLMPLQLDEDQMRALQEEGQVILKASAGSGKTTTIVGLYLHLLMKGHKTSELVAITFTEKAAAELRERIYRAVEHLKELGGKDEIMISLPHAPIGTIHSFCARTLREYPLEASVPPDFRVMEEVESQQILRESVRTYLDRLNTLSMNGEGGEEVEAFRKVMAAMGHSIVEVRKRLRAMVSLGRTFNRLEEEWRVVDPWELAKRVERLGRESEPEAAMADMLWGEGHLWRGYIGRWIRKLEGHLSSLEGINSQWREDLAEVLSRAITTLKGLLNVSDPVDAASRLDDLLSSTNFRAFRVSSGDPIRPLYLEAKRDVNRLKAELRDRILRYLRNSDLTSREVEITQWFLTLSRGVMREYRRQKAFRKSLDFSDILERTYRLLTENPWVLKELSKRYRHIIVDEYQDTDFLQMKILKMFTAEGTKLYLVGDPQQSIYRFRGSEVSVFRRAPEIFSLKEMTLKRNYRSRRELIEHFNRVFERIFPAIPRGDFEISLEPMKPALQGEKNGGGNPVEVIVEVGRRMNEVREEEARRIASRISLLLQEGYNPGDIGILFRNFTRAEIYHRALKEYGIPHTMLSGGDFYSSQVVSDVISLMKVLLFPHDRVALTALLRSPMVGLSDEELYHYYRGKNSHEKGEEWRRRADEFLTTIRELQGKLYIVPTRTILEEAIRRSGYRVSLATLKDGEEALANLEKILKIIEDEELSGLMSPMEILEQLTLRQEVRPREGVAQVEVEDSSTVKLMTIHGAKGLEFPVVILADMAAKGGGWSGSVLYDEELGYLVPPLEADERAYWRRTPLYGALNWYIRQKECEEEKRILYVGATRAKEKLIYSMSIQASSQVGYPYLEVNLSGEKKSLAEILLNSMGVYYIQGSTEEEVEEEILGAFLEEGITPSPAGGVVKPVEGSIANVNVEVDDVMERVLWKPPVQEGQERATEYAVGEELLLGEAIHCLLSVWRMGEEEPEMVARRLHNLPERILRDAVRSAESLIGSPFMNLYESLRERGFKVLKEVPLSFMKDGRVFQGRADLVVLGETDVFLFDYKYTGGDEEELHDRYNKQIELYSEALRRSYPGREIHAYLVTIPGGNLVEMASKVGGEGGEV